MTPVTQPVARQPSCLQAGSSTDFIRVQSVLIRGENLFA
jgi:hypothetical protein